MLKSKQDCKSCEYINFLKPRLHSLQAEISKTTSVIVEDNSPIEFDTILSDYSSNSIKMENGVFKVLYGGVYNINYVVNTDGTGGGVDITLSCNGVKCEATYNVQGQMSGFATLFLNAGDIIELKNVSGYEVAVRSKSIPASILITTYF